MIELILPGRDSVWERSSGQLVRYSFQIYAKYFFLFSLTYGILALPFRLLDEYLLLFDVRTRFLAPVALVARILTGFLAGLLVTILVSDGYLGYVPSLHRAVKRVGLSLLSKVLVTELIFEVSILASFAILVLPGIILYCLLMFSSTVAILEGTWGLRALRRSLQLGRNYYARNGLVMLLPYSVYLLTWLASLLLIILSPGHIWLAFAIAFKNVILCTLEPVLIIRSVLLYYDMRIRNEAFDLTVIPEELRLGASGV